MKYPAHLLKVIDVLRRLPGVGSKSAERFAFQLLTWPPNRLKEMASIIETIPESLRHCQECGCLSEESSCAFCTSSSRSKEQICIILSPKDAYAIESTHEYQGLYHVLGGVLSPMDGMGPDKLNIAKLKARISALSAKEIVIAIDSTLEGDATALYLKMELEPLNVNISRLAFGIPMGSSLDYVDGGTLARAFQGRLRF